MSTPGNFENALFWVHGSADLLGRSRCRGLDRCWSAFDCSSGLNGAWDGKLAYNLKAPFGHPADFAMSPFDGNACNHFAEGPQILLRPSFGKDRRCCENDICGAVSLVSQGRFGSKYFVGG